VDKKGIHQIDRISDYLNRSGRRGFSGSGTRLGATWKGSVYGPLGRSGEELQFGKSQAHTSGEIRTFPEIRRDGKVLIIKPERMGEKEPLGERY
jgi:hypothetical protein